jgi:cobalamin biosynthesis Mg chelatase CobN
VPNTTKESTKPKHNTGETSGKSNNPAATASEAGDGKSPSSEGEPEESGEKEKSQTGGAAPNGGGNGGNGGEASNSTNDGGKANDGIGESKEVEAGNVTPVAHQTESSGGGSSPVVPILIAVIALAAISIGVVLYRQRKSGQGPDSRVSSPNAS